jgi:hypothetical protein
MTWDGGNPHFPATSWQASNLNAGTGAGNERAVVGQFAFTATQGFLDEKSGAEVGIHFGGCVCHFVIILSACGRVAVAEKVVQVAERHAFSGACPHGRAGVVGWNGRLKGRHYPKTPEKRRWPCA